MAHTFSMTIDPKEYDQFVKYHKHSNLLQSSSWGKVKDTWGHHLTGLKNINGELTAAALVLVRPVKFGWSVWYIPHGPIMDYQDNDIVKEFFTCLKTEAKKNRCAFLKIDPPVFAHADLYEKFEDVVDQDSLTIKDLLTSIGFIHQGFSAQMHDTIQPRYQAITFQNETDIKDRLSKRAKKEVRDSVKKMVEIERVRHEGLDEFCYLIGKTEEAKDINLRNKEYFENILNIYGEDCFIYIASIDLAEAIVKYEKLKDQAEQEIIAIGDSAPKKMHNLKEQLASYTKHLELYSEMREKNGDKALIAAALSILYGHSFDILYAGFNRDFRGIPGQDPVFLKSMEEAFAHGAKYVNMGGVENNLQDGLMEYKKNFDPHVVSYLGEFDLPVNKLLYKAYRLLRKILT
ncbi:MAG: peptidoglycan bridge formation glycyltransferase FemA/FemB family protein [Saccharofermentanales bacterium]|jgi:serine/alanine adding enzyme